MKDNVEENITDDFFDVGVEDLKARQRDLREEVLVFFLPSGLLLTIRAIFDVIRRCDVFVTVISFVLLKQRWVCFGWS